MFQKMLQKKGVIISFISVVIILFIIAIVVFKDTPDNTAQVDEKNDIGSGKTTAPMAQPKQEVEKTEKDEGEKKKDKDSSSTKKHAKKKQDKQIDKTTKSSNDKTEKKNDAAIANDKKQQVSFSTKYVSVSSLNVRKEPNPQSNAVGMLTINQEINAADHASANGWVQVKTKNITGYVNAQYISDKKTKVVAQQPHKQTTKKNASSSSKTTATNKEPNKPANNTQKAKQQPQNDADKLKTVGSNNQLILVTAAGYGTSQAHVQTFERNGQGAWDKVLDVPGHIGRDGFAATMSETQLKSPRGKYSIGHAFGRNGNPGTKLSFKNITSDDVWVDDPKSSLYNTWQSKKQSQDKFSSAEEMNISAYSYGFVINYNTARTPGAGSAIFFHISNTYTYGCTGVSQSNVVSILRWLDPAKNPVIIQTPINELGNY